MFKSIVTKLFSISITATAFSLFIIFTFQTVCGQISLVKDICTLYDGGESGINSFHTISFKGSLIFSGNSAQGRELWISDGTAAGTTLLKDINPGAESSNPSDFIITEDYVYFFANGGLLPSGKEIWRTDGTTEGTVRVDKFNLGAFYGQEYVSTYDLTPVGDQLYFLVGYSLNSFAAYDLWVTDATVEGTTRIKTNVQLNGGQLAALNGALYFAANDAAHGLEIWKTNGTSAEMIGELIPGPAPFSPVGPYGLRTFGNAIYFIFTTSSGKQQLWKSDGTLAGTHVLTNDTGVTDFYGFSAFYPAQNILYMTANTPTQWGMWMIKDDSETIRFIKSFNPALNISYSTIKSYVAIDTVLYYSIMKSDYNLFSFNYEVWKSDGTPAGTIPLVENMWDATSTGTPYYFTNMNGSLYFTAGENGDYNVWRSDGTPASTYEITDIDVDGNSWGGAHPSFLAAVDETLFFVADHVNSGNELWKTNGTVHAEQRVTDCPSGNVDGNLTEFAELNGRIIFPGAHETMGLELFSSDGTEAGTSLLKDIRPGPTRYYGSSPSSLFRFGNAVYFNANDGATGEEVWRTDGTTAGTMLWNDIVPGSSSSYPRAFFQYKNSFVFVTNENSGRRLWSSDGNAANTTMLGSVAYNPGYTVFHDKLYFINEDYSGTTGGLWVTDGSVAGTQQVKQFFNLYKIVNNGEKLILFVQTSGSNPYELWVSDGTSAGTTKIAQNFVLPSESAAVINGNTFFSADDGVHGKELWKSDGTAAGTSMVLDLFPGSRSSNITAMIALNNTLIFSAEDGANGKELWKSDGTAEGTQLLNDIFIGSYHADPSGFIKSRGYIYFTANDGVNRSLYKTNGTTGCGTIKVTSNTDVHLSSYHAPFLAGHKFFLVGEKHNIGNELFIHDQDLDLAVEPGCRQIQSIVFDEPADLFMDGENQSLSAYATSELPVSFLLSNSNATLTGNNLAPVSPGSVTIMASQQGNELYEAAESIQYVICVNPGRPTISEENSEDPQLISSSVEGNQWFRNNEILPGETSQMLSVQEDGNYSVNVTINGCMSLTSEEVAVVITGITPEEKWKANVYPTIAQDFITVEFQESGNHTIQMISISGRVLAEKSTNEQTVVLPLTELSSGIYFIRTSNYTSQQFSKFIKK
jgi:ELWxxDGT repeat protein